MAASTTRKSELKSTSFSAMGVPASPGSSEIAADDPVEAATSCMTVFFFSSSAAMVFAYDSGLLTMLPMTKNDSSAMTTATSAARPRRR